MTVFRMREYKTKDNNPNVATHKVEMTTEHRASSFAQTDTEWIYFYAELSV